MIKYRVRTSSNFDRDIDRLLIFLATGNSYQTTISKTLEAIYKQLQSLQIEPEFGIQLKGKIANDNDFRYLISGHYLIFYKIYPEKKLVRVLHVYHSKENYLVKLDLS